MKLEKSCRKNSGKIQFIFGVIASILCLCLFTLGDLQAKEQEKQYQKIINDKKKELVGLNEKIQLLDLGSESRKRDEETFEKKNMELESYANFADKSLMKKYKDYFGSLYTEVCKEVEDIGKREQYDLIIKKEEPELQSGGIS